MKNKRKLLYITIIITIIILLLASIFYSYINNYYKADTNIKEYLKSSNNVKVSKNNNYYYFDGKSEDKAIIFYPGGKVEYTAYAPILHKLSENGIDCFLIKMPFNLAILNKNAADSIIKKYKYKYWYLAGHSLGGVAASTYTHDNKDKVSGLILLASYPNKTIDNKTKLLSIYGTNDGVLDLEKYKQSKKYWSKKNKEFIIYGANHSGFGNYGHQSGDKKALITNEQQQQETIDFIINRIGDVFK
ncbi:MAG: alpha/beta hydrolase [Bacilli bacterium]|nr:alpha/beta hydrolase [Bacilli bacterium]